MKRRAKIGIGLVFIFVLLTITTMMTPCSAPPSGPVDPGNGTTPDPGNGFTPGLDFSDNYQRISAVVEDFDNSICSSVLLHKLSDSFIVNID